MDERKFIINEGHVGNKIIRRLWTWDEFKQRAMQSASTNETHDEYMKIVAADRDRATKIKDVGGFVAGEFSKQIRQKKNLISRSMVTLDIERQDNKANKKPDVTAIIGRLKGKCYTVFSTHKHTVNDPRIRIILPLLYDIPKENYSLVAGMMAQALGVSDCLDTVASIKSPHQIMFWSSHPKDIEPFLSSADGELWDPADYMNESDRSVTRAKKQKDPGSKPGPIGTFCRAYQGHWPELVKVFDLPYEEVSSTRWSYSGSSSGAGVIIYSDGLFINSFHASDPACGMHNFYDVVRLHRFAGNDKTPPEGDLSRCGERETIAYIKQDIAYQKQLKQEQEDLPAGAYDPIFDFRGGTGDGEEKKAMKDLLFEQIMNLKPELYHTSSSSFMDIKRDDGTTQMLTIGSGDYRGFARRLFREKYHKIPNRGAVDEAAEQLTAEAQNKEVEMFIRCAQVGRTIYYDLGNESGEAVQITANGWHVMKNPSVKFFRTKDMGALPTPEKKGSIDSLREFVNLETEADFKLFVGFMLSCMQGDGDYFILNVNGPNGSGKSTISSIARLLVDPLKPRNGSDTGQLLSPPKDDEQGGLQAAANWLPAYDNLSKMSADMSDFFCRIVTGVRQLKRKLYTDNEMVSVIYKRPVLLNGIPEIGFHQDFIDRLIRIRTKSLKTIRRPKSYGAGGLRKKFMSERPKILGAMFDALSCALRSVDDVKLHNPIRSIDAAMFVTAAEQALGWSGHDFEDAVYSRQISAADDAIEHDTFTSRLAEFMRNKLEFTGTATEIINQLAPDPFHPDHNMPTSGTLKKRLEVNAEALRDNLGITWSRHPGHGGKRFYTLHNSNYQPAKNQPAKMEAYR